MKNSVISLADRFHSRFRDTEFDPYLQSFRLDCEIRNLTQKTMDGYVERLAYLFAHLSESGLCFDKATKRIIRSYILSLKDKVSDETINGRIRVYRRFFNHLISEELWEHPDPMAGIKLLKTEKRIKPIVGPEDIQKIIGRLRKATFEGNRNLILLLLYWDGMLRKTEALKLKTSELDLPSRMVKVYGKGRKERMVPLGNKTLRLLHRYIVKWRSEYPGEHLICMRDGNPVTDRHCHKIIQQMGQRAGLKLHPHLLRHSAATWYIRQGGNPAVLQGILGHTSLLVTQQYLHLTAEDAVNSYAQFSPANGLRF